MFLKKFIRNFALAFLVFHVFADAALYLNKEALYKGNEYRDALILTVVVMGYFWYIERKKGGPTGKEGVAGQSPG